jgi:hypothetical protein
VAHASFERRQQAKGNDIAQIVGAFDERWELWRTSCCACSQSRFVGEAASGMMITFRSRRSCLMRENGRKRSS